MAYHISKTCLKTATVALGLQYSYVFQPAQGNNATFLLLHGFPSSAYDWRHQFDHLTNAGYGVLIPDLLGYGGTDKPLSVEPYAYANQSEHLVDILKKEGLDTVIGVGHDWGASLLARFLNYHPNRFSAVAFLSSPYRGPEPVDLGMLDTHNLTSKSS
jgi:soluble epoxide hydrolase/lipid-phosphate phosphatase